MKLVIGADHRGFAYKEYIKQCEDLSVERIAWIDVGAFDTDRSDYPVFAKAACTAFQKEKAGVVVFSYVAQD